MASESHDNPVHKPGDVELLEKEQALLYPRAWNGMPKSEFMKASSFLPY